MIKTLDQQKETRSTPNIEPRAGDTETTPTPSEEDDFEEHNTFQLRPNKNNSNRSPQRELELKQKLNNVLEKQIPKIENGRAAKNSIKEKCLIPDATATAYSLDESLKLLAESSVILCRDNCTKQKKSIAVAIEEPSTSRVAQKSSIVIKIEENCFSPAISIGSSDDGDSSSPGNESFADESSERTAKSSSVMKIKEEDPSQDKFETNLNDRIQVEDKCPLPVINKDDDDADDGKFSLPGKQASSADETKNGEASSSSTTMDESHSPDEILDRHLSKRIKIEEKYQLSSRSSGEETSSSPVIKIDDDNSQDDQIDNEEETFLKVGGQKLSQDEEHSSPAKILILKSESPVSLSSSSASSPTSAPVIKIDEDNSQDDHSDNDEETLSRVGKDSLSQDEENSSPTKNLRLKSKSPLSLSSSSASSSTSALNISEDIKSEEPDDFVVSQEGKDSSAYGIDENKFSEKKNERTSPVDHQQGNDSDRSSSPVYAIDEDKLSVKKSRRTSVESQQLKDSERASSPDEEKFSLKKSERTTSVDLQQGNDSDRSSSPVYAIDEDKFSVKESRRTSVESQQLKDSERASSPDEEKFSLKKSEQTSPVDLQQGNDSDRSSSPVYAIDEDKFSVKESRRTSSIESQQGKDSERSSSPDEDNFSLKKSERTSHAEIQHGKDADRSSSPDFAIDDDKCSVKESRRTSPVESQQGKDSNSSSSPALAIHEDKFSVKESQRASPSAVTPSDLLPVTGAADEDASADSDDGMQIDDESFKLPKTECAISATVTKIESKSGEEDVQAEKNQTVDCQNAPATKNSKIKLVAKRKKPKKLNGLHSTFDRELKELAKQKQDLLQLSVTENNHKEPNAEQQAECSRRTSRSSSTVSSTSQQLVIDHPESEQKSKQHHHLEQQQTKDQQLLFASKRRRTGSNNNDNNNCNTEPTTSKRQCVEEQKNQQDQQSSLLLQRLQAPVQNTSDLGQTLSCYKCNAQSFDNFQQLNAHHEVCKATTTSTDVPTTATTIDADASVSTIDLAPSQPTEPPKERFYRCARCSTVHQCWHFFLHMRDVHQRYLCLYCSHVFASVEKLSLHLENKHDMDQRHFAKVEEWRTLQTQEDRPRYLICCTCQATFESGSQFEDHDCAELMQPCALCGQKGAHFNGCKNGNTVTDKSNCNRKKTAIAKRKRKPVKRNQILPTPIEPEKPQYHNTELPNCITETKEKLLQEQQQQQQSKLLLENNIPAPIEDAPQEEPMHRLVVPKIMLRVPKEFQKSVDAALSSTDTEDDENDELTSATESASLLTVDAVHQQQQQEKELQEPLSSQSDDTETATETASTLFEAAPMPVNALRDYVGDEDLKSTKLPHVLAEFERTKLDIARTMAELLSKRHLQKEQQRQQEEELQHQQHLQQQHQQLHQQEQQQPLQQMQQQQQQPLEQLQQQQQQQINELQQQLHLQQQEQQPLLQLKQQQLEQLLQQDGQQQQQLLPTNEATQQRRRWSLTPPASPHNNNINQETHVPREQPEEASKQHIEPAAASADLSTPASLQRRATLFSESMDLDESINVEQEPVQEQEQQPEMEAPVVAPATPPPPPPPADGIEVAGEDTHTLDLQLDRPLDKFEMVDFVRLCLKMVYPYCLYCNHARRIAVDARQLVLHLIGKHRFTATVDSITAEELHAETIVMRLKSYLPAFEGGHYMNSESCCSLESGRFSLPFNERLYECFQCRYVTASHKELYTHNRRLHIKANIKCCMCRLNFFSFSELLCHICPGVATCNDLDLQFRCCLCERAPLPSAFRLMVHMRKQHQACDICLEDCHSQAKLSSHVWKHKLLHLCYRCGISYRNKLDISKHLFWKHGTESASCKRCLQKRWRHVYHFCIPPAQFTCEHCLLTFSKAIYLEVHKRQHLHDFRYACNEEDCEEKFVSRKLLLKHAAQHIVEVLPSAEEITKQEQASADVKLETGDSITASERTDEQAVQLKTEMLSPKRKKEDQQVNAKTPDEDKIAQPAQQTEQQTPRKRRKKNKRNKASLEDLNLIAPNLSESDSSDDSDSDAARSIGTQQDNHTAHGTLPMRASVDDLDMPRVMLSPSSESDSDEQADRDKEQPKESIDSVPKEEFKLKTENVEKEDMPNLKKEEEEVVEESQEMPDIWKNLLQHQPPSAAPKMENEAPAEVEPTEEQLRPVKMHVIISDHDYCKMRRTPPPTPPPSPTKLSPVKQAKAKRGTASSDSDSSSSGSSNSDSDSSSCSCGSNCSCSSSASSSSDDDSDNESSARKKNIERIPESNNNSNNNDKSEDYVNVTAVSEVEPRPATPVPQPAQLYNESDYDTNVSDTDEEFYDAHPQKMAREMAEKRLAENSAQHNSGGASNNYLIVENSRPSTPSLPEEAASFADKRERVSKNKKKKRERKSTCKSTSQVKVMPPMETPMSLIPQPQIPVDMGVASTPQPPLALLQQQQIQQLQQHLQQQLQQQLQHQLQLLPESPITPITHRPNYQPRMSEGSSCSDADGQLKRSKRTRRPNKFYGYTSDDENMSSVLAPPLQVGMQLIKPQPPPQLTWAKEDLPTPPKQHRNRNNHNADHQQQQLSSSSPHNNSHQHSNGSGRKRPKHIMRLATGGNAGSGRRAAKRVKQSPVVVTETTTTPLPPIPTLKIRPALLPVASADPSDTSESSSDEDDEINVTSLMPPSLTRLQPPALVIEAPPPPATKAFNQPIPPALLPNPDFGTLQYFKANNIRYPIRPPAGARQAREGESVYCYCRCPYDEVSEMIACDGQKCMIEWFHFECVGIMVAPQGKWFCAECRPKYSEGLYPGQMKAM